MSDEALEGCGLARDYTVACYLEFTKRLAAKAASLGSGWDAEKVGRAMWARAMVSAHGLSAEAEAEAEAGQAGGDKEAGRAKAPRTAGKRRKKS